MTARVEARPFIVYWGWSDVAAKAQARPLLCVNEELYFCCAWPRRNRHRPQRALAADATAGGSSAHRLQCARRGSCSQEWRAPTAGASSSSQGLL